MFEDPAALVAMLASSRLFANCPTTELEAIAGRLRRRRFRKGEVIFHQGDPGDSLHIVASGAVKIALPSPEGEEAIIATLRPGDFFGELSLLDGAPRSATAAAVEASETLVFPRDAFRELLATSGPLRDALLSALATELRRLTGHVEDLHFLDIAGRLASRLAHLAREAEPEGGYPNGVIALDWPYTQSDLAAMIGATRQSVNRLLADLVDQDLVRIEHETLVIPDLDQLDRLAAR